MDPARAAIHAEICAMIKDVVGEAWIEETPITMDTSFVNGLEMESIELVALSEKIQERWGDTVDFPAWLSSMELDRVIALTVGDLVDHIAACRSKT